MPLLTIAVFAVVAAAGAATIGHQPLPGGGVAIDQPVGWVSFSADVVNVYEGSTSVGRYFRRSDGSTAMALITPGGVAITIHNVARQRMYSKVGNADWKASLISRSALDPPRRDLRLQQGSFQKISDAVIGDVYELANPKSGNIVRIAPRLNGMRISERRANGTSTEFFNFILAEQPDHVFEPPQADRRQR